MITGLQLQFDVNCIWRWPFYNSETELIKNLVPKLVIILRYNCKQALITKSTVYSKLSCCIVIYYSKTKKERRVLKEVLLEPKLKCTL